MQVVFMGTPEFALPTLEALLHSRHEIVAAVTATDKPFGRARKLRAPPVKKFATGAGIPLLQPHDLTDADFIGKLAGFKPDIGVVVAFRILPPEVYDLPRRGCLNLHPSLLPELRGAAPINWALMRGLSRTGVTTFLIERRIDTGTILLQKQVNIEPEDDAGSLGEKLAVIGAELVIQSVDDLESGAVTPIPQRGVASSAPKLTNEIRIIDWRRTAGDVHNQVRGLAPVPGAISSLDGRMAKVYRTKVFENLSGVPGTYLGLVEGAMVVGCGHGSVGVEELQLEGKRRMTALEFLHGNRIEPGARFDGPSITDNYLPKRSLNERA